MKLNNEHDGARHYEAFISYKHGEKDTVIAENIQNDLEHFHIPKTIQRETGCQHITRIFRDKNELSLTDDLTQEIREALEQSRYLIVICSKESRESVWVKRELDLFLESHTLDQVLTVLIDGEPGEVLPERILESQQEPLSADYRLPEREAKRTELPRIAAAILGCGYDDLVRRTQQHRIRLMTASVCAIGVIGVIAVSYLTWSRAQIAGNLREATISKCHYLATQVDDLLNRDLNVSAAQLAPYTVPEDRSLTPAASWYALQTACGAYMPEITNGVTNHEVTGELKLSGNISILRVNHDRTLVCILDTADNIHVWDTANHKDLLSFRQSGEVYDIILAGKVLVVGTKQKVYGYAVPSGKRIWTLNKSTESVFHSYSMQTDEKESKVVILTNQDDGYRLKSCLSVINPKNGTIQKDKKCKNDVTLLALSDDGRYAACMEDVKGSRDRLCIYDLKRDKRWKSDIFLYYVTNLQWLKNGSFLVWGYEKESEMADIGSFLNLQKYASTSSQVYCITTGSTRRLWQSDVRYGKFGEYSFSGAFSYKKKNGAWQDSVYVTEGNILQTYDAKTGRKIRRYELPENIVFSRAERNNLRDSGVDLRIICSDGADCSIDPAGKKITFFRVYRSDLGRTEYYAASDTNFGFLTVPDNDRNEMLQYSAHVMDEAFVPLKGSKETADIRYAAVKDGKYVIVREDFDRNKVIAEIYERKNGKLLHCWTIPSEYPNNHYLGLSEDGTELFFSGNYSGKEGIFRIALNDGSVRKVNLSINDYDHYKTSVPYDGDTLLLLDNRLYYVSMGGRLCCKKPGERHIRSMDLFSWKRRGVTSVRSDLQAEAFSVSPDQKFAFAAASDGTCVLADLEEQKVKAEIKRKTSFYDTESYRSGAVDWDLENNHFSVAGDHAVYVYDLNGRQIERVSYQGQKAVFSHFWNGDLLVLFSSGNLSRYSVPEGELKNSLEVSSGGGDEIKWEFYGDLLYLQSDSYCDIIDTKEWEVRNVVPRFLLYDRKWRRFVVYNEPLFQSYHPGYFPEYSLDDLLEKCKKAANGQDLDRESKLRYGVVTDSEGE